MASYDEIDTPVSEPDRNDPLQSEHPLKVVVSAWERRIKDARNRKRERFGKWADECMEFFEGDGESIWEKRMVGRGGVIDQKNLDSNFRFVSPKGAELVQIFGPHLYNRNPVRSVTPRDLPKIRPEVFGDPRDPQVQQRHQQIMFAQYQKEMIAKQRAELMSTMLNFTPNELDLKSHARRWTDETLIKGVSCMWTEIEERDDGTQIVGTFFDSVDNFIPDPECTEYRDCLWIARECWEPVWKLADEYDVSEDMLRKKAALKSASAQAHEQAHRSANGLDEGSTADGTNDLVRYYKIWSKMGIGDRHGDVRQDYGDALDAFGDNVYLVIVPGCSYPLNLKDEDFLDYVLGPEDEDLSDEEMAEFEERMDEVFMDVQWPIPYHLDGRWPMTPLCFHEHPNQLWGIAHLRPALGHIKFINWGMSFLAEKVRHSARVILGAKKHLDSELKEVLESGGPVECVDFSEADGTTLKECFDVFVFPQSNKELLEVMQAAATEFEKATGLNEIMHGMPGGMRSAREAQGKFEAANVRPDDMANRVEDMMSEIARKEALAAIWMLEQEDVEPILGPGGAEVWEMVFGDADPEKVALELDYRIESGSARRPNKQTRIDQINEALQIMLPIFTQLTAATGDVGPLNQLMTEWAKAMDIDPKLVMIPQPKQQEGPDPAQQAEMQKKQAEMQAMQQKHQLEREKQAIELQIKTIQARIQAMEAETRQQEIATKLKAEEEKLRLELAEKQAELAQAQQEHDLQMRIKAEEAGQELALDEAKARQERKRLKDATEGESK